ncbi:hypothetical protein [Flavobacterium sp.]|uniref:hypothetical protein n=1 Tax=Flavobacterium sp. TaxID=239 RepID=UPI0025DDF3E5|nr:hypothetical protein [Flavobacterium sp.]
MNRFVFIFLFALTACQAQSIYTSEEHLLFKEAKSSQTVLILNDSVLYKGNPLHQKRLLFRSDLDNLKSYIPFAINNKNYLIYHGCGPVLEWRNDSIVRIDKSFFHKNQYGAVSFVYNKKVFFWGGYGLFTHKNILTQFNFKTKEWDEVETFGTPPSPRRLAHGIIINTNLYIFSGYEKDEEHFLQIKACEPAIWKLHLPTMQWSLVGKYDLSSNLNSKEGFLNRFTANEKLYIIPLMEHTLVYEIDFKNNTLTTFRGITKNVKQSYFDTKTKEVVYINQNADGLKSVLRTPLQEFLGRPIHQQVFLLPWYQNMEASTLLITILGILGVLSLGFYFSKRKPNIKPFNGITFKTDEANYYYKGKLLDTFEEAELRILDYLVQNRQRFIPLNELNHLYENEIQLDNFTTVVKRREVALASLMAKLLFITKNTEKNILVYKRSLNDKRMKEIKLKDSFIKVK